MNQNSYHNLIDRIWIHCQQVAQEAASLNSTEGQIIGENYVGWYIDARRSFIALKKKIDGQKPTFAFAPATEQQIQATEQQLGFALPPLLRLLYVQIANGGFGPGYGIIGAIGGYPFPDASVGKDIAQAYHLAIDEANEQRQSLMQAFIKADQEEQRLGIKRERGPRVGPDGRIASEWEKILTPHWPEHLLPLCEWGCNIYTYIDAKSEHIFQGMGDHDLFVADSLEEWLERWLAGESLQFL